MCVLTYQFFIHSSKTSINSTFGRGGEVDNNLLIGSPKGARMVWFVEREVYFVNRHVFYEDNFSWCHLAWRWCLCLSCVLELLMALLFIPGCAMTAPWSPHQFWKIADCLGRLPRLALRRNAGQVRSDEWWDSCSMIAWAPGRPWRGDQFVSMCSRQQTSLQNSVRIKWKIKTPIPSVVLNCIVYRPFQVHKKCMLMHDRLFDRRSQKKPQQQKRKAV